MDRDRSSKTIGIYEKGSEKLVAEINLGENTIEFDDDRFQLVFGRGIEPEEHEEQN